MIEISIVVRILNSIKEYLADDAKGKKELVENIDALIETLKESKDV